MKKLNHLGSIAILAALLVQGCASYTEHKSVYAGPWASGFENLGPLKVKVHPAAQYDRDPYGAKDIRGFRVVLDVKTNTLSQTSVSDVSATYTYAPLKEHYDQNEHPLILMKGCLQPGIPDNNVYTLFLQPKDHLNDSGVVREGRYKMNLALTCEGKRVHITSETHLAYERTRGVYFTPIVYLVYLLGGGWSD